MSFGLQLSSLDRCFEQVVLTMLPAGWMNDKFHDLLVSFSLKSLWDLHP